MSASDIDMHSHTHTHTCTEDTSVSLRHRHAPPPDIHAHRPIPNIPFSLHIFFLKLVFIDLRLGELHHETETLMSFLTEG